MSARWSPAVPDSKPIEFRCVMDYMSSARHGGLARGTSVVSQEFVAYSGTPSPPTPLPSGGEGGPHPALSSAGAGRGPHSLPVVGVRGSSWTITFIADF